MVDLSLKVDNFYDEFEKPKKSGGTRVIRASNGALKNVQRWILDHLLSIYNVPSHIHGCVAGRSIATNASAHTGKERVINIDLEDFFGTISPSMVARTFFELGFDAELSDVLVKLTTYKGSLPQGAPTSPMVANMVAIELDNRIMNLLKLEFPEEEVSYSRYVDDISISGPSSLEDLIPRILGCVESSNYRINRRKVSVKKPSSRQMVTGLVVNKKVNPSRSTVRKIRQELYYCKKYGVSGHCEKMGLNQEVFLDRIRGKIGFVRMSQPGLAASLEATLVGLLRVDELSEAPEVSEELKTKVAQFEALIRLEKVIDFKYKGHEHTMAPSEVFLSSDGSYMLKGFQLKPKSGWRTFYISKIEDLEVQD